MRINNFDGTLEDFVKQNPDFSPSTQYPGLHWRYGIPGTPDGLRPSNRSVVFPVMTPLAENRLTESVTGSFNRYAPECLPLASLDVRIAEFAETIGEAILLRDSLIEQLDAIEEDLEMMASEQNGLEAGRALVAASLTGYLVTRKGNG